ncbi:uncharacterized protein LOC132723606 [Ruditapes philippinarum]|uniref:uncharacterized protein LOC132723606 n=1 Tax=Ruditapes philippinarum TaxID=129788 RepID=UPI00295B7213|nr:uncharacterized protein LOC132723606 [Ruditapes philippinarum]
MADLLFKKIVEMYTVNGEPKVKNLGIYDCLESIKVLSTLNMLDDVINQASQAEHVTVGVKTKFDNISVTAYSKSMSDEKLTEIAQMAPADMSAKQKVRFMEIVAASMEDSQAEGRISPASSQESQADCDLDDVKDQGRVIWTHEAILLLIDRRRELSHLFDNNAITQRQAWRKVAEELKSKGYKYSEDDCSKKFRSLRARYKTVKERNSRTGNSRQSWRYFEPMEEMFAGDPAVLPTNVVSSMRPEPTPAPVDTADISQISEEEPSVDVPMTSTPRIPRKRRRSSMDSEDPPQWFERYQQNQQKMHEERMQIENRRVTALESLVKLFQEKK